jgi:hypothetical protein
MLLFAGRRETGAEFDFGELLSAHAKGTQVPTKAPISPKANPLMV